MTRYDGCAIARVWSAAQCNSPPQPSELWWKRERRGLARGSFATRSEPNLAGARLARGARNQDLISIAPSRKNRDSQQYQTYCAGKPRHCYRHIHSTVTSLIWIGRSSVWRSLTSRARAMRRRSWEPWQC